MFLTCPEVRRDRRRGALGCGLDLVCGGESSYGESQRRISVASGSMKYGELV